MMLSSFLQSVKLQIEAPLSPQENLKQISTKINPERLLNEKARQSRDQVWGLKG